MFFKRMSRSRSNSQTYVEDYQSPRHDSKIYENDFAEQSPGSAHHTSGSTTQLKGPGMYTAQDAPHIDYDVSHVPRSMPSSGAFNAPLHRNGVDPGQSLPASYGKGEAAPDLLTRAFNEAIRPYTSKLDELEGELADMRLYAERLEAQQREVYAWIDKRGLRPDVPPSIAALMDAPSGHNPSHAAATLNAQLDRKITIVNFDLHRLQDDLNDSLPTPSFSACMLKFLPDIARLTALPTGPRHAFDLLLKLGGNLNSHGGLETGDEEDLRERRAFYARLDDAMVEVVRGRFRDDTDSWNVAREIKRIEKTGAYLRTWGVEPYFPKTLEVMREGGGGESNAASRTQGGSPAGYD